MRNQNHEDGGDKIMPKRYYISLTEDAPEGDRVFEVKKKIKKVPSPKKYFIKISGDKPRNGGKLFEVIRLKPGAKKTSTKTRSTGRPPKKSVSLFEQFQKENLLPSPKKANPSAKDKYAFKGNLKREQVRNLKERIKQAELLGIPISFGSPIPTSEEIAKKQKSIQAPLPAVAGGSGETKTKDKPGKKPKNTFDMREYVFNEDRNYHGKNATEITKLYGTATELNEIIAINNRHKKSGSITREDQLRRDAIASKYWNEFEADKTRNPLGYVEESKRVPPWDEPFSRKGSKKFKK